MRFLLFCLAALIGSNAAFRMRPQALTKPGITCDRVHATCKSDYRGTFPYTDGCQMCMCRNGQKVCQGGPCSPEGPSDKTVCDQVRRETAEMAKDRAPCLNAKSVCPTRPFVTFRPLCKVCTCISNQPRAECRNRACPRIKVPPIRATDRVYAEECAKVVQRHFAQN